MLERVIRVIEPIIGRASVTAGRIKWARADRKAGQFLPRRLSTKIIPVRGGGIVISGSTTPMGGDAHRSQKKKT
jgi:hypothetical protein